MSTSSRPEAPAKRPIAVDDILRWKVAGAPVLSPDFETSMPGLHVIGPASADSFGPVSRFVFGAIYPARRLAARFAAERARVMVRPRIEPVLAGSEGA